MKIKTVYKLAIIFAAVVLFVASIPLQASKTDDRISLSARDSYVFKTYLKDDAIKVQSKDGVVTLTGTVSDDSHKSMAEETVESLPGVKSVNNQLSITGSPASANSDAWLAERVRSTLLFHRSVSYVNTSVAVSNGNVTLTGKASSEAQKQLTTEYAKDVSGVKDVDNQMIIANAPSKSHRSVSEKIDDASITTQVRMSLLFHHGTDMFDTKVSTHKGVVTLSGSAKNQAEIDLATKRVSDVHGVTSVKNQMTIEAVKTSSN
jgi:hyperosmotically inducible periplasmic protein